MAEIILKDKLSASMVDEFIEKVYETCKKDSKLSPRSKEEIRRRYRKREFIIALESNRVTGWLLKSHLTDGLYEISAVYVNKEKRKQGIFRKLLKASIKPSDKIIFVTFVPWLSKYLQEDWGFTLSHLWEIIRMTRGKFLLQRLNMSRFLAICKHFRTGSSVYFLLKK